MENQLTIDASHYIETNKVGLRLSERMAGWVQFLKTEEMANFYQKSTIEFDAQYPFAFSIDAFTTKLFSYPFTLFFHGTAEFPGLPAGDDVTFDERLVPITGTMSISLKGVAYEMRGNNALLGEWTMTGSKRYRWWPFSLATFKHSLIWLPATLKKNGRDIAVSETLFLPPLWQFPFGLSFAVSDCAHRPHYNQATTLYHLGTHLFPKHQELGDRETLVKSIERQLAGAPWFARYALKFSACFINCLAWLCCFSSLSGMTPKQGQKLLDFIQRRSWLKVSLLPTFVTILYPIFEQKDYLRAKGQNIITPPKHLEPEPWMKQSLAPRTYRGEVMEADCVVIGSGAGGAVVAAEMAKRGKAVVVLEQGHYFKRQDLNGMGAEMMRKLYTNGGVQFSLSHSPLWIPTGRCVGGTTFVNSGTCIRTPEKILQKWKEEIGPEVDLAPYFPQVEEMLGGVPAVPQNIQGGVARILERGLKGTEYSFGPLRRAESGCDGQSYCVVGCPTGAKRSTAVSFLPEALKRNAFLLSHMEAEKIIVDRGVVKGVKAKVPNYGEEFSMTVKAPLVVVAGGTFGTPDLLYRSELHKINPHIGKHLTIHPALTVGGLFSEVVRETMFVPQSLGVFGIDGGDYVLEGYTLPVDVIPSAINLCGQELAQVMERVQNFTNFSSMIKDPNEGQLWLTGMGPVPIYPINEKLRRVSVESIHMLAEIFFRAGAEKVYTPVQRLEVMKQMKDLLKLQRGSIRSSRLIYSAHHPLGTCRMAKNENHGVVDAYGEMFGVENLVIADGSTIPGPLGVNPQVTIMANAMRIAQHWSDKI